MNSFVTQSHLLGTRPVVLNTLNIPKPADGEPTLLTLELVRTLFHEFGHALHGLFSDVRYPMFAGHGRAARLRRVPLAGQRDVAGGPGDPRRLRPPPRDRRAAPAEAARQDQGGPPLRRRRRDHRVPGRRPARPGLAPARRRTRRRHRRRGVRSGRAGRRRRAQRAPALPLHLLQPRLRRGLQRRVLLLHLERGARRRHRRVVHRARRAAPGERRALPPRAARPRRRRRPDGGLRGASAAAAPDVTPLLVRRGLQG